MEKDKEEKFYTQAEMDTKDLEIEKYKSEAKTYRESNERLHDTIKTMAVTQKEEEKQKSMDEIMKEQFGGKRK